MKDTRLQTSPTDPSLAHAGETLTGAQTTYFTSNKRELQTHNCGVVNSRKFHTSEVTVSQACLA